MPLAEAEGGGEEKEDATKKNMTHQASSVIDKGEEIFVIITSFLFPLYLLPQSISKLSKGT